MHEDTRFTLVRAAGRRNTLRPVRRSSCIMHQFAVVGYKQAREGSESEVSDVSVDVVIYHLVGTAKEPWSVGTCGAQARG